MQERALVELKQVTHPAPTLGQEIQALLFKYEPLAQEVAWVALEHEVQLALIELQLVQTPELRKAEATQALWTVAEVQVTAN